MAASYDFKARLDGISEPFALMISDRQHRRRESGFVLHGLGSVAQHAISMVHSMLDEELKLLDSDRKVGLSKWYDQYLAAEYLQSEAQRLMQSAQGELRKKLH